MICAARAARAEVRGLLPNHALHRTHPLRFASWVFPRSLRSLGAAERAR
jgi:hypothetical protein